MAELSAERVGRFDVVLFLGVLYHLRHPFAALERVAALARELLVVESRIVAPFTRRPVMHFYPGSELDGDPTNWWAPNRPCMEAMLRDLGFRRVTFRVPTTASDAACSTRSDDACAAGHLLKLI